MRLNQIYDRYKDRLPFYAIYIREAHPDNGWRVPENLEQGIHHDEPTSDAERAEIAAVCKLKLDLRMPMLIDWIDNDAEEKYLSTPIRLYVVDRQGGIAYTGAPGPFGFDPDSWERAIAAQVGGDGDAPR